MATLVKKTSRNISAKIFSRYFRILNSYLVKQWELKKKLSEHESKTPVHNSDERRLEV